MLTDDMRTVVENQRLGFVATVDADGRPNLSPKGSVTVLDNDRIAFADLWSPGTVANLRERPWVEINVVDHIRRRGYRFKGEAVVDPPDRSEIARTLTERRGIRPERMHHVVVVTVTEAAELLSPSYRDGATEPEVVARWRAHYGQVETERPDREDELSDLRAVDRSARAAGGGSEESRSR